ncbi:MAG: twin-arginine translocation signal domain-containing protein, partial [Planctomycetia bacterium]|nr:twin-arginine translocation signal domain-containing protein [Planctomycetia bacterium]
METRRDLLKALAAAATTTLGLPEPQARANTSDNSTIIHPEPTADAIIVL